MEHRLILGGEQFLPFARSCVAKLKKLGLPYADQSFEVEGCSIKVRIEPGHEYIRIDGGAVELRMDSGIVELFGGIDVESPDSYAPRLLHYAGAVIPYSAGFSETDALQWKLNPGKTNVGQLAGNITYGQRAAGKLPQTATIAASFAPQSRLIPESAPSAYTYWDDDASVWAKKVMVNTCPASIFTGKCRLYVQAMYGAHSYAQTVSGTGTPLSAGKAIPPFVSLHSQTYGTPSLDLAPYLDADDKAEGKSYLPLQLFSGCGVYLDPIKGRHWLFIVGTTSVDVYPMRASAGAESLRKHLVDGSLNQDDAEHLEAYILASSQHYARKRQTMSIPETPNYSLGYSWHWNWSGTAADIAFNKGVPFPFEGGFNRTGLESTHYRLSPTPSRDLDGNISGWAVAHSVISGPEQWSTHNIIWSVYEPTWNPDNWGMENVTPYYGSYVEGSGTFYVFYKRDEIQICRIEVKRLTGSAERTFSDMMFVDSRTWYNASIGEITEGANGGWCEDIGTSLTHHEATVRIGSQAVSGMYENRAEQYKRVEIGEKSFSTPAPIATEYTGTYSGLFTLWSGYPIYSYPSAEQWAIDSTYGSFSTLAGGADAQDWTMTTSAVRTLTVQDRSLTSSFTVIVPFYDAEAVFFHYVKRVAVTASSVTVEQEGIQEAWASAYGVRFKNGDGTWTQGPYAITYKRASLSLFAPNSAVVTTTIPPDGISTDSSLIGKSKAPAVIPNLAMYHGTDADLAPVLSAWAGVRTVAPLIFSPAAITPVGTTTMTNPAVVGWV